MCKRRVCAIDKRTEKGKGKREEKGLGYNTTGTGIGSIGQAGRQAAASPEKNTLRCTHCLLPKGKGVSKEKQEQAPTFTKRRKKKKIEKQKNDGQKVINTLSHLSMHFAWYSWLQGRTRSVCLVSNSHMQMTQVLWPPSSISPENRYDGS